MRKKDYRQPCACGCGDLAKPGRRFLQGHNSCKAGRDVTHPPKTKPCSKCRKDFLAHWYGHGYDGYCKTCAADYMRERQLVKNLTPEQHERKRRKARERYRRLKAERNEPHYSTTYGISAQEAHAMRDAQGGKCLICSGDAAHLDHDHETGQIRGWLCRHCNIGLGCFNDSAAQMAEAIRYLDTFAIRGG